MNKINLWITFVVLLLFGFCNAAYSQCEERIQPESEKQQLANLTELEKTKLERTNQLYNQSKYLINAGHYEKALQPAKQELELLENVLGQGHSWTALSMNQLGVIYLELGNYREAEEMLRNSIRTFEKSLFHCDLAIALDWLGFIYKEKRDYEKAKQFYQAAFKIRAEHFGIEHQYFALSLTNLAELEKNEKNYQLAKTYLKTALKIYEKKAQPIQIAATINSLAVISELQNNLYETERLYQRALGILKKTESYPDVAQALRNLAKLAYKRKDYRKSYALFQEALELTTQFFGSEHRFVADLEFDFAVLSVLMNDEKNAVQLLEHSNVIKERDNNSLFSTGSERQKQRYVDKTSGSTSAIISLHLQNMPTNDNAARLSMKRILGSKGWALDNMTNQFSALRKGASSEDQILMDKLHDVRSQLATLQISNNRNLSSTERQEHIKVLSAQQEHLEEQISRNVPSFSGISQPVTIDRVRQLIPEDAALVEMMIYRPFDVKKMHQDEAFGEERYAVYILRRDNTVPQFIDLGRAEEIDAEAKQFWSALKDPNRLDFKNAARQLDERVMRPIRKLIGSTRTILLSPDGALNLVPFAALIDENGKYLIENYSLSYLSSGRDLLRMQNKTENLTSPIVITNPLYEMSENQQETAVSNEKDEYWRSLDWTQSKYAPLPATEEEGTALVNVIPTATKLSQSYATEAALKQVKRPLILHIATHGFFLENQSKESPQGNSFDLDATSNTPQSSLHRENPLLRSGLILAGANQLRSGTGEDGIFTALEATGLDLWGTKLVVLSACDTGLGDVRNGDGVYGLRRAMVLAGSETQIISLWKVSDEGTRDLMTEYYRRLYSGEGRTEALRQVQINMLNGNLMPKDINESNRETLDTAEKSSQLKNKANSLKGVKDYRHPYYWAAFIPSGDWRNMNIIDEPRSFNIKDESYNSWRIVIIALFIICCAVFFLITWVIVYKFR